MLGARCIAAATFLVPCACMQQHVEAAGHRVWQRVKLASVARVAVALRDSAHHALSSPWPSSLHPTEQLPPPASSDTGCNGFSMTRPANGSCVTAIANPCRLVLQVAFNTRTYCIFTLSSQGADSIIKQLSLSDCTVSACICRSRIIMSCAVSHLQVPETESQRCVHIGNSHDNPHASSMYGAPFKLRSGLKAAGESLVHDKPGAAVQSRSLKRRSQAEAERIGARGAPQLGGQVGATGIEESTARSGGKAERVGARGAPQLGGHFGATGIEESTARSGCKAERVGAQGAPQLGGHVVVAAFEEAIVVEALHQVGQPVQLLAQLSGHTHRRAVHLVQACACRMRQYRLAMSGCPAPRATPRARPPPRCTPCPGLRMSHAPNQAGHVQLPSSSRDSLGAPTAALYTSSRPAHGATGAAQARHVMDAAGLRALANKACHAWMF